MRLALGTRPSSLRVSPKYSELKTLRGKFCVKLCTFRPCSWFNAAATSKRVVSTGNVFMTFPLGVWRRRRASVYAEAGFEDTGPEVAGAGAAAGWGGGAWPARAALSRSAFSLRSSLSASIFARIRCLASISSCFSLRRFAASFSCSFFLSSSFRS